MATLQKLKSNGDRISSLLSGQFPILALLGICLVLGLFVARDYSQSWDENYLRIYANDSLQAYSIPARLNGTFHLEEHLGPTNLRYYGPAYLIFARLASGGLGFLLRGWTSTNLYHLLNFLTFLGGVYLVWRLSRRLVGQTAALGAAALFASQPLLWGHGFINLKDIPFLTLFLWAMESGFWMADQLALWQVRKSSPALTRQQLKETLALDWQRPRNGYFVLGLGCAVLFLCAALGMLAGAKPLQAALSSLIRSAYQHPETFEGKILSAVAGHIGSIPVEAYVLKGLAWLKRLEIILGLLVLISLLAAGCARFRITFLTVVKKIASLFAFDPTQLSRVFLAGLVLGVCTSVRLMGPFAGVLICCFCLLRSGLKVTAGLAVYALAAMIACYCSWPFLWPSPINNFYDAVMVMTRFPNPMTVLFNGQLYDSSALPASYLPTLMGLSLSLPALALILAGLVLGLYRIFRGKSKRLLLLAVLGWFAIPFIYVLASRPPLYDNTRQFLFLYPALFVFSGLGLEGIAAGLSALLEKGKSKAFWRSAARYAGVGLALAALLPGLIENIRLHPYQYAYYNALTGGQAGAFRKYEEDYWLTSYKSAVEYLKTTAPKGSKVSVYGGVEIVQEYADPSWTIEKFDPQVPSRADYAILSTRSNKDLIYHPDWKVIQSIGKDGALFAVIKAAK